MLPLLVAVSLGGALGSGAAAQRASLYSSRALTAEDAARLGTADGLLAALRAAATRSPAAHLTLALVSEDELHGSQQACSAGNAVAAHFPLSGDGELTPLAAAEAQLGSVCNVYWVGAWPQEEGVKTLSVAEYEATLAAGALENVKGCTAYLLAAPPAGLPCAAAAAAAAEEGAGSARLLRLTALVSWPGRSRGLGGSAGGSALAGGAGPKASGNATLGINMGPQILEGLSVGALLLLITFVGVYCITTVATPDVLHTDPMPAGKEY